MRLTRYLPLRFEMLSLACYVPGTIFAPTTRFGLILNSYFVLPRSLATSFPPIQLNHLFNVGEPILMQDFNEHQLHQLILRHGLQYTGAAEKELFDLLGGHP